MGSKTNLQQLAKTLAQKTSLQQKDAEAFLREFFDAIIQNVTADKTVKVKGFGTFKLIEVLDRESVNVNTGERIVIPGHSKLSFTPDTALKDLVNKPFADFQAVVINEGTSLEDMERVPQEETEQETDEEAGKEALTGQCRDEEGNEPVAEAEKDSDTGHAPRHVDRTACLYGPPPAERERDIRKKPEVTPLSVSGAVGKKPGRSLAKVLAWGAAILLLCLLCFLAGRVMTQKPSRNTEERQESVATPVAVPVEAPAETPAEEVQYAQVPGGAYRITGTRKTYVMKPGDFITRIAIQEYNDKDIAQYIIVHNDFHDPDNIPVGAEIKLPELEPVE